MYIQNRALFNSKSIVLAIKMAPFAKNNHASIGVPKCHYIPYETFMRRYTFGDEICCGGFCAVYAATRNLDNRPTAIKLVPNDTIYRWDLLHGRLVPIEVLEVLVLTTN